MFPKQGLKIEGVVLHRVVFLEYFRPKQGRDFKPLVAPLYPNMSEVSPGPLNQSCIFFLFSVCFSQGYSFQSSTLYDQSLRSPSYPNNYPPSSNCLWSLQRPSSVYAVKLTFSSFSLESKSSCSDDYVEIRDGDLLSSSKLIGKFCGSRLPPIIVSSYKYIFVRFVSDFDNYPFIRTFSATFRAIVPGTRDIISSYYGISLFTLLDWKIFISFDFFICMSINLHQTFLIIVKRLFFVEDFLASLISTNFPLLHTFAMKMRRETIKDKLVDI